MYKAKSKILATMLTILIILQMIPASLANGIVAPLNNVKGEVLKFDLSIEENLAANNIVISYEENDDGSVTLYEYKDGELIEVQTTVPGSGVIYHERYNGDCIEYSVEQVAVAMQSAAVPDMTRTNAPDSISNRPLGYMHYNNMIGLMITIYCHVEEEAYLNQSYTLYEGTAEKLSTWIMRLLSVLTLPYGGPALANEILGRLILKGVLREMTEDVLEVAITETITCSYFNQQIYGECTTHDNMNEGLLEGTYIYYDGEVITEGYTTRMWGTNELGRMMFYEVVGVEYNPTSWTHMGT